MINRAEIEEYERIINDLATSDSDKQFLMELKWTTEEFGKIESQEQYEAFGRAKKIIEETAEFKQGLLEGSDWFHSQQGIVWTILVTARSDWEEAHR